MKTLLALAFGSVFALAANGPVREVTSQAIRVGNQPVPGFQKGYLFFLDYGTVRLYPPDGFAGFVRVLEIPKGSDPSASGLAVDTDGSVAVSVGYRTGGGFGGGIAFLDAGGRQTAFLDTGLYMPSNLCYGEDHSLWAFGWQRHDQLQDHQDRQDYMMVRKYSTDRKEAGRYLARSLFPKGLEPGSMQWQSLRIAAVHDRVGLLAWSGNVSSQAEWVELDLDGKLIRRIPIDNSCCYGMAFTSDGHLYRKEQYAAQLLVLDQNTPEWRDAGSSPGPQLWGADGNQLVFSPSQDLGPVRLQWFAQPAHQ